MTLKTYTGNIKRKFVKHPLGQSEGTIEIHRELNITSPIISIVIPTIDAARDGYLPALLNQLKQQTFQNYEVILIIADSRQGRAINCGVQVASGRYIVTFDDDTKLGRDDILEKMVAAMKQNQDIGMAGVANTIPKNASFFVKRVMKEIPRRTSPIVLTITDSDLAEHPCCIIPREVFIQIGGENEIIPRGLDPYLRREIRRAGYHVVVLPDLFIHHLPPKKLTSFIRQFYRNGKMAAYVNKYFPEFVIDLPTQHEKEVAETKYLPLRVVRYIIKSATAFVTLRLFYLLSLILYSIGFIIGYITLKEDDI